jgi:hypothetical protein
MITEQWEYMKLSEGGPAIPSLEKRLAAAGKDGWEGYAVTGDVEDQPACIWLKRRIPLSPAMRRMMAKGIV